MTGRLAAARSVGRVVRGGAYSNRVIAAESRSLSSQERRTAHRIAYGTLRWMLRIDRAIGEYSSREARHIQPAVWDVLRTGTWEILFGDVHDAIAVSSAVDTVRDIGQPKAASFVNAVLRSLVRSGEPAVRDRALAASTPAWLVDLLDRQWGPERTDSFLAASNLDAAMAMRARPLGAAPPDDLVAVAGIPDAYEGRTVPDKWIVQDAASTAVGWAVGPDFGEAVLDMAAAPGGKALHLADQGARVTAIDVHRRRLDRARSRLEGEPITWLCADGRAAPFPDGTFSRVLLDAPCSGLGVLRRRPEIKYRLTASELQRLAGLQRRLLAEAERLVAPGGTVTYSVCTVTNEETIAAVGPQYSAPDGEVGEIHGSGRLLAPDTTGTDGMFIARWQAP